ncbi:hypothetical protein CSB20_11135 [bacterium DOLZORAL124_64_63]|nr:MAG: hypothetical protein CSB20_11135 [bacterium DOLZORAL124_64_63]
MVVEQRQLLGAVAGIVRGVQIQGYQPASFGPEAAAMDGNDGLDQGHAHAVQVHRAAAKCSVRPI